MGKKAEFPNILSTVSGKLLGSWILWKQFERFVQQFLLNKSQCDCYNRDHLDIKWISLYFFQKWVSMGLLDNLLNKTLPWNKINNMDWNQPITTYRCNLKNPLKKAYVCWEVR